MKNPFQWEHPKAFAYNDTIRKRIIGYEHLFILMADLIAVENVDAKHVIVVGAGGGQELATLAPLLPDARFTAIDPSDNMLMLAKARLAQEDIDVPITYIAGELVASEIEVADIVTCHLVLHFLKAHEAKRALLTQIAQSVRIGGRVFLSSINGDVDSELFQEQLKAWERFALRNGVKPHQWEAFAQSFGREMMPISSAQLLADVESVGLRVVQKYYQAYGIEAYCLERVR